MIKKTEIDLAKVPSHVGIIMDGNRRWAAARGLGPVDGHRVAAEEAIEPVVQRASELGIKYLTLWAFSTENWKRDKEELEGLMQVFRDVLGKKIERLNQKGVRLNVLGDLARFPKDIVGRVLNGLQKTATNERIVLTIALNYGGRPEILTAVQKMIKDKLPAKKVTEEVFAGYLGTKGIPDPDLIIRTGGQLRLSGFMPWQAVYSELYFTSVLWPDFGPEELDLAVADFQNRQRRFGGGSFKDYGQKKG